MELNLSDTEKLFIIHGAEESFRNDGRSCDEFRQIILETGILSSTDGSARIRLGSTTDVVAGIKLELEGYEPLAESRPVQPITFFVDFSANASYEFAGKGGDSYGEEVAAAFQEAYSQSLGIFSNLEKTQVALGHRWRIHADVTILQWDGSVVDAISLAIMGALSDLNIPEVDITPDDAGKSLVELRRPKQGDTMRDEDVPVTTWKLDVSRCPLLVSVSKVGKANLIDCTPEEETCVRSQLWVGVTQNDDLNTDDNSEVTMVKQVGGGLLEIESINEMTEMAIRSARSLRASFLKRLSSEDHRRAGHTFLF